MRKLYTILVAILFNMISFAQSPDKMSYQALVRDSGDNLVVSQAVGMQISILQGSAMGTAVYTETHSLTTNINGLVSLEIGAGTTTDDFTAIDWSAGPYFIKTETDPAGGSSYSITGTSQLLSVPFALYSANTAGLDLKADISSPTFTGNVGIGADLNVDGNMFANGGLFLNSWDIYTNPGIFSISESGVAPHFNIIPGGNVGIGTSGPTAKLDIAGTVKIVDGTEGVGKVLTSDVSGNASWQVPTSTETQTLGDVIALGNTADAQIKNVTDPTDAQDAVTKVYVDGLVTNLVARIEYLESKTPATVGDLRAGGIVFWVDPIDNTHGLVCALFDQSSNAPFGCPGVAVGASGITVGTGASNTVAIETGCTTPGTAADICVNLSLNGYSDWFLGSEDEMLLMYQNIGAGAASPNTNLGNFTDIWYICSTESYNFDPATTIRIVNLGTGAIMDYGGKNAPGQVRAVRAF